MSKEYHVGITTDEIAEKFKEVNSCNKPCSHQLRDKFLTQLVNQEIVNKEKSELNWKGNIWYPADEDSNVCSMFENSEDLRLKITDRTVYPMIEVLDQSYTFSKANNKVISLLSESERKFLEDIKENKMNDYSANYRYVLEHRILAK